MRGISKTLFIILVGLGVGVLLFFFFLPQNEQRVTKQKAKMARENQKEIQVRSSAFGNNQQIPKKYTCDGENISPPLSIESVPDEAVSLVLTVDDPDAPGGTWTHWMVWNIPAQTRVIEEGKLPTGAVEGKNSFGNIGYGGPCPPSETHRYVFKVYALDTKISPKNDISLRQLEDFIKGKTIAEGTLVGTYTR